MWIWGSVKNVSISSYQTFCIGRTPYLYWPEKHTCKEVEENGPQAFNETVSCIILGVL